MQDTYTIPTSSWVIVSKETGKAVFETYQQTVAEKVNTDRYTVMPVMQYLQNLNTANK